MILFNDVPKNSEVEEIERLMLTHFCTHPFHNLNLLFGVPSTGSILGGTCSDKTLAFLSDIKEAGFDAHLHTAYINGQEIHRLVRVCIYERLFFADIGNGWPTLRLIPADEAITFGCFGMYYRTEVTDSCVRLFHHKQGKESLQLEIYTQPRPEAEILTQIQQRYSSGVVYPFSNSLRFSLVAGEQFLFLRGNRLEMYSESDFQSIEVEEQNIPLTIEHYFGISVKEYFN